MWIQLYRLGIKWNENKNTVHERRVQDLRDWRDVSSSKTVIQPSFQSEKTQWLQALAELEGCQCSCKPWSLLSSAVMLRTLNLQARSHSKSYSSVNLIMKLQGWLQKCYLSSSYSALGNRGFSQITIIATATGKLNVICVIGRSTSSTYWYWQTNNKLTWYGHPNMYRDDKLKSTGHFLKTATLLYLDWKKKKKNVSRNRVGSKGYINSFSTYSSPWHSAKLILFKMSLLTSLLGFVYFQLTVRAFFSDTNTKDSHNIWQPKPQINY